MKLLCITFLTITALSLSPGVTGLKFQCGFTFQTGYEYVSERIYRCNVENELGARPVIDGVTGKHKPGKTNADVRGLEIFYDTDIEKFPVGVERVFPNLVLISVGTSRLKVITSEDLKPFPQLKYLRIHNCHLKVIPADLFVHTPLIEVLILTSNIFEDIAPTAFSGLKNLRVAELESDACSVLKNRYSSEKIAEMIEEIEKSECAVFHKITTTQSPPTTTTTTE